ncbi:uncharacterized protein LOC107424729 [Ziziphus jujuba]|uniref:Uncharacterized protein LOC107424729 n=1 Tax=Ziziphus jujuba TaxID=326968 RepID=A0ABM3IV30_ZIZJJ|nr:uncharacterized protein LOC107424729 [Ziziphus jujuba]
MGRKRERSEISSEAADAAIASGNNNNNNNKHDQIQSLSHSQSYEQTREERIRENLQKMQKLGIFDLSLKLNSHIHPKRTPLRKSSPALPPSGPLRRSSRLQNVTPVSYTEVQLVKNDKGLEDEDILPEVGSKPEIYTDEHEKLLGNTEKSWELFVDGCGPDGKRIYDPVKGKTCHQCRQKTLGHRTHCCKCNKVQGQFCGDCLYMRYGEHVLEAIENPDWMCPACRGICNCSLCRQAKGWAPTGTLYKKISQLGFKSVAHYLIQTRRRETNLVKSPDTANHVSAKRLLQFSDKDEVSKESLDVNNNNIGSSEPQFEDQSADKFKSEREKRMHGSLNQHIDSQISVTRSLSFSDGPLSQNVGPLDVKHKVHYQFGLLKPQCENKGDDFESEKEKEMGGTEDIDSHTALSKLKRKPAQTIEPSIDTIAGRLRQRRKEGHQDNDFQKPKENVSCCKDVVNKVLIGKEVDQEIEEHFSGNKHDIINDTVLENNPMLKDPSLATEPSSDSIAGRLKLRSRNHGNADESPNVDDNISDVKPDAENIWTDKEVKKDKEVLSSDIKHKNDSNTPLEKSQMLEHKHAQASGPSLDSIAGRLRQRRREADDHDGGIQVETKTDVIQVANCMSEFSSSKMSSESMARRLRPRRATMCE